MALQDIKGNEKVIRRLLQSIKNETISHAYIFEADGCMDKLKFAQNFIKAVLCKQPGMDACDQCISCQKIDHDNHEDVIYVCADGSSIKDEAIEGLQSQLKKKPYVGDRNVVIVEDADTMTLRAQNRFLKTLEEPALGTIIILLSENIENLVKTILSRCVVIHLNSDDIGEFLEYREGAGSIGESLLKGSPFYKIVKAMEPFIENREKAYLFLDALEGWFRDLMLAPYDHQQTLLIDKQRVEEFKLMHQMYDKNRIYYIIDAIEATRQELKKNINVSYALKHMVLETLK
ncbi:DNA polymerase III subunit [Anaerovorax sp. IOR16]|uniref:DNA polymerase III subunit n=1 Tax=Anaerovorax sp. IOR16 TaxID=2773458 RepID=UPI0019D16510|nr:DNA polymerase III subunit [Anaerovorax sp. IOR16]